MKKKAQAKNYFIVFLLLGSVTLILLLFFINTSFQSQKINNQIQESSKFIEMSNFKSAYFGNKKDKPTMELIEAMEKYNFYQNITYEDEDDITKVHQNIENCWLQGAKGYNFLSYYKGNICIICGKTRVKDNSFRKTYLDNIENLDKEKLTKNIPGVNFNNETLFHKQFIPNDNFITFYYIEQRSSKVNSVTKNLKANFKLTNNFLSLATFQKPYNKGKDYTAGVILSTHKKKNGKTYFTKGNNDFKCDYLIHPETSYD